MVPRDKHTAGGSQARLVPTRSIQGRLGSKKRIEGKREKRNTTTDTKAYRCRDRQRKDSSRLNDKKSIGSMLPVWQEGTLHE